jgi:hypothetical protein
MYSMENRAWSAAWSMNGLIASNDARTHGKRECHMPPPSRWEHKEWTQTDNILEDNGYIPSFLLFLVLILLLVSEGWEVAGRTGDVTSSRFDESESKEYTTGQSILRRRRPPCRTGYGCRPILAEKFIYSKQATQKGPDADPGVGERSIRLWVCLRNSNMSKGWTIFGRF